MQQYNEQERAFIEQVLGVSVENDTAVGISLQAFLNAIMNKEDYETKVLSAAEDMDLVEQLRIAALLSNKFAIELLTPEEGNRLALTKDQQTFIIEVLKVPLHVANEIKAALTAYFLELYNDDRKFHLKASWEEEELRTSFALAQVLGVDIPDFWRYDLAY